MTVTAFTTAIVSLGIIGWCVYKVAHAPLDCRENDEDYYKDIKE